MTRKKTEKIEISKDRLIELRKIIDENRSLYDKNSLRLEKLEKRQFNEKNICDIEFLKKLYHNIPVVIEPVDVLYSLKNAKFVVTNEFPLNSRNLYNNKLDICTMYIDEDWTTKTPYLRFQYSQNSEYATTEWHIMKTKWLATIADRISLLQDEWLSKRITIYKKYYSYISKIDTTVCSSNFRNAQIELDKLNDYQKILPGNKYIFDKKATFYYGKVKSRKKRGKSEWVNIESLEILKSTPEYLYIKGEYNSLENRVITHESRQKKSYILHFLKENPHSLDKRIERIRKFERIVEELVK